MIVANAPIGWSTSIRMAGPLQLHSVVHFIGLRSRSKVEVKNIFFDVKNRQIVAAYIYLKAMWNKKYPIEFEAVDIFEFDSENKIKVLKIVLDTYPIRILKEKSLQHP